MRARVSSAATSEDLAPVIAASSLAFSLLSASFASRSSACASFVVISFRRAAALCWSPTRVRAPLSLALPVVITPRAVPDAATAPFPAAAAASSVNCLALLCFVAITSLYSIARSISVTRRS